ncbi:allophanate hydrolase subunit 1 [Streptomyces sp. NPDC048637]|uniref:5-oxoprolinase subunit B family protein n=1 Tax=Streptomyces sp. NPDC048637 TaxID=3155636 RepID=UPI003423DDF8
MSPAPARPPVCTLRRVGSTALLAELDSLDDVLALRVAMQQRTPCGVGELVAAARTLLVTYDPAATEHETLAREVRRCAEELTGVPPRAAPGRSELVIPVRYDGPDLDDVAERTGMSVADVIARHTAPQYTVAFAGFAPGFGYLHGTDPALRLPRRAEPRTEVPAGAVAVASEFTGVYPRPSPGGWQLLGTTSLTLWDAGADPPALLVPGRTVRLRAVSR